jgi:hypothetical protein
MLAAPFAQGMVLPVTFERKRRTAIVMPA